MADSFQFHLGSSHRDNDSLGDSAPVGRGRALAEEKSRAYVIRKVYLCGKETCPVL